MKLPANLEILTVLLEQNFIGREKIEQLSKPGKTEPEILEELLDLKIISKDLVGQAIAEHYKVKYFDLNSTGVDLVTFSELDYETAKENRIVVVEKQAEKIVLATDNPDRIESVKLKLSLTKFQNKPIEVLYSLTEDLDDILARFKAPLRERIDEILSTNVDFATAFFHEIVKEAIDFRASDIHIEPLVYDVKIRFRIDGILSEVASIGKEDYENIINKIKVTAGIRIDEHYRSQDGAIRFEYELDNFVDLRISIVPILEGQKVVIRVLSNYAKNMGLDGLGLSTEDFTLIEKAYKKTFGMILTTGPTGSGKTTTLYSILKTLHTPEVNITTIEDPVEYRIVGVNQIQVDQQNDITFAKGLRSIVRQDPNIILVGEVRDFETAEIAINAALTGHLLLSSFHANDASSSIPRLLDMGIEPFLLASTLNIIVAQRLVRRTCNSCKYSVEYSEKDLKALIPSYTKFFKTKTARLYKGKGCPACNHTGFKGRLGVFEIISVTEPIQRLIMARASSLDIKKESRKSGSKSFFEDGLAKVIAGDINLEELLRVVPADSAE
jgi:type IV pilus assembly protein PilB